MKHIEKKLNKEGDQINLARIFLQSLSALSVAFTVNAELPVYAEMVCGQAQVERTNTCDNNSDNSPRGKQCRPDQLWGRCYTYSRWRQSCACSGIDCNGNFEAIGPIILTSVFSTQFICSDNLKWVEACSQVHAEYLTCGIEEGSCELEGCSGTTMPWAYPYAEIRVDDDNTCVSPPVYRTIRKRISHGSESQNQNIQYRNPELSAALGRLKLGVAYLTQDDFEKGLIFFGTKAADSLDERLAQYQKLQGQIDEALRRADSNTDRTCAERVAEAEAVSNINSILHSQD